MTEVAREDLLRELTETHNVISKLARELRSPYSHKSATPRCHHPPCAPSPLGRLAPLEAGMARSRPGSFADSRARGTSEAGAGRLSYGSPRPQRSLTICCSLRLEYGPPRGDGNLRCHPPSRPEPQRHVLGFRGSSISWEDGVRGKTESVLAAGTGAAATQLANMHVIGRGLIPSPSLICATILCRGISTCVPDVPQIRRPPGRAALSSTS